MRRSLVLGRVYHRVGLAPQRVGLWRFVLARSLFRPGRTRAGRQGGSGKGGGKGGPAKPSRPVEPAPRWPDGRVNLGAAPGHKGYWELRPGFAGRPTGTVPFQPWAKELYDYRQASQKTTPASLHRL